MAVNRSTPTRAVTAVSHLDCVGFVVRLFDECGLKGGLLETQLRQAVRVNHAATPSEDWLAVLYE